MQESFTDDFTRILPIFLYGDPSIASSIAPEMETSIQKDDRPSTIEITRGEVEGRRKITGVYSRLPKATPKKRSEIKAVACSN